MYGLLSILRVRSCLDNSIPQSRKECAIGSWLCGLATEIKSGGCGRFCAEQWWAGTGRQSNELPTHPCESAAQVSLTKTLVGLCVRVLRGSVLNTAAGDGDLEG